MRSSVPVSGFTSIDETGSTEAAPAAKSESKKAMPNEDADSTEATTSRLARDPGIAVALAADAVGRLGLATRAYGFGPEEGREGRNTTVTGLVAYEDIDAAPAFYPTPAPLRALLDALAYIVSSASLRSSVACALRLLTNTKTVELILSGSNTISPTGRTVHVLRTIWAAMQRMTQAAEERARLAPHGDDHGRGKKAAVQKLMALRLTLYAAALHLLFRGPCDDIYMREEGMAVIEAWRTAHSVSNRGGDRHLRFDLSLGNELGKVRSELVNTLYYLDRVRGAVVAVGVRVRVRRDAAEREGLNSEDEGWEKESDELTTLICALELSRDAADRLMRFHAHALRLLSARFFGAEHILTQAFRAVTALPRHVYAVLQFAANCMDGYAGHEFVLQLVTPISAVPCGVQRHRRRHNHTWTKLGAYILEQSGAPSLATSRLEPVHVHVHPELTVATYMHAMHYAYATSTPDCRPDPPYDYLGTAHPPCAPCALWLGEYNARSARQVGSSEGGDDQVFFEFGEEEGEGIRKWSTQHGTAWGWVPLPPLPEPNGKGGADLEDKLVRVAWDVYVRATVMASRGEQETRPLISC